MEVEIERVIKQLELEGADTNEIDYYISFHRQPFDHEIMFRELLEEHYLK